MSKRKLALLCLAAAALLLLSGCGILERAVKNPAKTEPTSAPENTPAPSATATAALTLRRLGENVRYFNGETNYTVTTEEDGNGWTTTRLVAEEDNGWDAAVDYEGFFQCAYYCEGHADGPCILLTVSDNYGGWQKTYVIEAGTLGEGGSMNGYVQSVEDGVITMSDYALALGKWAATRTYVLGQYHEPLPTGDGLYHVTEERYVSVTKGIPVQLYEEGLYAAGTLAAGEELTVTATDGATIVYFKTRSGRTGYIEYYAQGGQHGLINGISQDEYFAQLPYAG